MRENVHMQRKVLFFLGENGVGQKVVMVQDDMVAACGDRPQHLVRAIAQGIPGV